MCSAQWMCLQSKHVEGHYYNGLTHEWLCQACLASAQSTTFSHSNVKDKYLPGITSLGSGKFEKFKTSKSPWKNADMFLSRKLFSDTTATFRCGWFRRTDSPFRCVIWSLHKPKNDKSSQTETASDLDQSNSQKGHKPTVYLYHTKLITL